MKLITAPLVGVALLGLCAGPFALAQAPQTSGSAPASAAATGVEAKIKAMEDSWAASQLEKDHGASVLEGLLAADYHGVGAKGEIRNKAETVEHSRSDTDTYTSSKNDSMDVHVYGSSVATVCGTSTEKGKDKDGKEFSRSYAWVDTWMERNGQWQCIAGSGTLLTKS
ncbi:MAG: nuclear transport factor 2 family protein [Verrucomicrobiota bacterium]|nr:nuclear transport factor 2 family protein [Chthoniobacterales bacterium]MDQ3313162.1 nuclear transport factor 2 family protein [Verrucomicrobiota bacterium]